MQKRAGERARGSARAKASGRPCGPRCITRSKNVRARSSSGSRRRNTVTRTLSHPDSLPWLRVAIRTVRCVCGMRAGVAAILDDKPYCECKKTATAPAREADEDEPEDPLVYTKPHHIVPNFFGGQYSPFVPLITLGATLVLGDRSTLSLSAITLSAVVTAMQLNNPDNGSMSLAGLKKSREEVAFDASKQYLLHAVSGAPSALSHERLSTQIPRICCCLERLSHTCRRTPRSWITSARWTSRKTMVSCRAALAIVWSWY